ncbi:hypothetical protein [Nocardioides sp. T2.26MG-1]|uniref:hypothetical protein n=1 Tax=Nocardioides sp. T2.26MG-1 TaxID=3041166 RepID=UPI0024775B45|nr:hypothetical protein [Nocardioides sp. T2.26MG-1]CAI9417276.1 hypothetical protein HIDPHFAB_02980 [Nocardioides sp. T2.26MG-1]
MSDHLDAIDMAAMRADTERHLRDDTGCRSCAQNVLRLLDMVEPFPTAPAERQTWERRVAGTDIAEVRIHLDVDHEGRVRIHEALAARLLHEAGWERTA